MAIIAHSTHHSATESVNPPAFTATFALVTLLVAGLLTAVVGVTTGIVGLTIAAGLMVSVLGPILVWTNILEDAR